MDKVKKYLQDKGLGFYFLATSVIIGIITLVIYMSIYGGGMSAATDNMDSMSWYAVLCMFLGIAGAVTLILFKENKWATITLMIFSCAALMFYLYGIYVWISVWLVAIDPLQSVGSFIICTVGFVLVYGLATASVFTKFIKKNSNAEVIE